MSNIAFLRSAQVCEVASPLQLSGPNTQAAILLSLSHIVNNEGDICSHSPDRKPYHLLTPLQVTVVDDALVPGCNCRVDEE